MPDIAAFDFDGTLTDGGSVFSFLVATTDRATVMAATAALAPQLARAAVIGGTVADLTKERLFVRVLAGVEAAHLAEVSERFARQHLEGHLRSDVRRRLDWHRDRGDQVVVVSASPECYVQVAGARLGVDAVIATQLEVTDHGALTGRYEGQNCRGEEKLRRLREWMEQRQPSEVEPSEMGLSEAEPSAGGDGRSSGLSKLWAYGNSRGDLRMLHAADVGVNVGRLGRLGRLRSFPGLDHVPD
jgi:HAD superfamily hydrolase (TIGR01490 family)